VPERLRKNTRRLFYFLLYTLQFFCTFSAESRFDGFHGEGSWVKTRPCCKVVPCETEVCESRPPLCMNRTNGVGRHTSVIPEASGAGAVGSRHRLLSPI
jgi:hypothetical protein